MDIKWKQQHINNACVSACLAMLLSQYKIEKEDSEIIYESKMPCLVEYNEEFKAFGAGVLMQNEEILNIVPNKHGLEFVHNEFKDYEDYLIFVENLLKNDIPFMTGIAKGFLPSPGYAQDKNISGHAVIIYKNEGDIFYILDPDGGIQRNKQNNFKEIEKYVSYKMNKKDLQAGLEARPAKKFTIGYLKEIEKGKVSISNIFNKSKNC